MTDLITLLDNIAKNLEFHSAIADNDEENIRRIADEYFSKFIEFYKCTERHKYSDVAKYIDSELQDVVDSLKEGISCVIDCAQKNGYDKDPIDSDNYKCYVKINKLSDHIELEVARYSSIKKIQLVAEKHGQKEEEIGKLLETAKNTVQETQDQAKKLSQQMISILGIFAGIIITFSFSTTIVGETVANLAKNDVMYLCFVTCVLGLIFMNVLSILMSFVVKLSGHKFSSTFPWVIYILANIVILILNFVFLFNIE